MSKTNGASWIKEMGITVCDNCIVNEHAAALAVVERDTAQRDLALCRESRNRYWREANHWKNVAAVEAVALVGLFCMIVARWV